MEKLLVSERTYRYEMIHSEEEPSVLLYVLHGYGQLARFFIRKFAGIKNITIVAPEGMHRFYIEGTSGRVGASWMTKEARELDIKDNLNWLNELHKTLSNEQEFEKVILLGFSQGGATAARWQDNNPGLFDALILWACVFPPDLEGPSYDAGDNSFFVLGKSDQYYAGAAMENTISDYKRNGFQTITFEGGHDIDLTTLKDILLNL